MEVIKYDSLEDNEDDSDKNEERSNSTPRNEGYSVYSNHSSNESAIFIDNEEEFPDEYDVNLRDWEKIY